MSELQCFKYEHEWKETPLGRLRGYDVDGTWLPGITSVLSGTRLPHEKAILDRWRASVTEEEANRGANRGTWLHNNLEKYWLTGEIHADPDNPYYPYWKFMFPVIKKYVKKPLLIEGCLFNHVDRYAGSSDLLCEWGEDRVLTLVDYKTSKKSKAKAPEDYCIQGVAYRKAAQRMYAIEIPQVAIIIGFPNKNARRFVISDPDEFNYYEMLLEDRLANFWKALEESDVA